MLLVVVSILFSYYFTNFTPKKTHTHKIRIRRNCIHIEVIKHSLLFAPWLVLKIPKSEKSNLLLEYDSMAMSFLQFFYYFSAIVRLILDCSSGLNRSFITRISRKFIEKCACVTRRITIRKGKK